MAEERFASIEARIGDLDQGLQGLRAEMRAMGENLRGEIGEVKHQMLVLHEDLVEKIAALAPDYDLIDRRIAAADNQLRDELLARIEPLEAAERSRRPRRR